MPFLLLVWPRHAILTRGRESPDLGGKVSSHAELSRRLRMSSDARAMGCLTSVVEELLSNFSTWLPLSQSAHCLEQLFLALWHIRIAHT